MNKPRTAVFILDLIAAVALAAGKVIVKYYLEIPKDNNTTKETTDDVGGPFINVYYTS